MGAEVVERLPAGARSGFAGKAPAGRGLLAQILGRSPTRIVCLRILVGRLVGDHFMLQR
jgi:hypothetical protein